VKEGEAEAFLAPLSVRKMVGIGEKTERKLNEMGIRTIGDLAAFDVSRLIERFGVMGRRYHQWAHGQYESKVGHRRRVRKSMGHERTFLEDVTDPHVIQGKLEDICRRICEKAVDRNLLFRTVSIKIRYGSYETFTRAKTLTHFTNDLEELRNTVLKLIQANVHSERTMRLVGVRVSNLKSNRWQKNLL
jgi:nucleotidyltransferase/DNA polymerase involved in DNA repair